MRRPALALIIGCLLLVAGASADPGDPWWNSSWEKRVPLTITDASATDGVQVLVNVTYDSDMQSDFDDLRFVQDDGSTPIPYWIETKSDGNYAHTWLKLPANDSYVWMYYGNAGATEGSDPHTTLEFYEDFSGDLSQFWISGRNYGTATIESGRLKLYKSAGSAHWGACAATNRLFSKTTAYVIKFDWQKSTYYSYGGWQNLNVFMVSNSQTCARDTSYFYLPKYQSGGEYSTYMFPYVLYTHGGPSTTTVIVNGSGQYSTNGGSSWSNLNNYAASNLADPYNLEFFCADYNNYPGYYDNIIVRKYADVTPSITEGAEETPSSAPTAAFTATPTAGLAPLTVQFTDTSASTPTAWAWTFGDGNTSSSQNPQHTYAAPGTYSVNLTATNEHGSDDELKSDYITVYGPVTAQFSATPTGGTAPVTVQFTDLSTGGPTSWLWTFGDGNTSTAQNPVHTYTVAGTHTVTLTASHPYDSDTETKTAYITVAVLQPFPGLTLIPRDLTGNGLYTDINGNNRLDYNDLTVFFLNLAWARDNEPTECFDFNQNGRLDYADVVALFQVIKNA